MKGTTLSDDHYKWIVSVWSPANQKPSDADMLSNFVSCFASSQSFALKKRLSFIVIPRHLLYDVIEEAKFISNSLFTVSLSFRGIFCMMWQKKPHSSVIPFCSRQSVTRYCLQWIYIANGSFHRSWTWFNSTNNN